tara:strand:+ start:31734 stop:32465 length:732 start_codon:yes stop_codon:yes gene_type:complete
MLAIFKREIQSFFTSPIGYLAMGLFLLFTGLFLWVFKGPFNIFDNGFADLDRFFLLAPWIFLFLIPAITMRTFSEEIKLGTLELLLIKPISIWELVLGKFLGTTALAILTLLPTLLYVYCIHQLGSEVGNLDMGVVLGSYFGMLFLICNFVSIGLFASTLSENQIVAFLLGVVGSFVFFYGFEALSSLFPDGETVLWIRNFGMEAHFVSVARGILDTRDLVHFAGMSAFFLFLTVMRLKNRQS